MVTLTKVTRLVDIVAMLSAAGARTSQARGIQDFLSCLIDSLNTELYQERVPRDPYKARLSHDTPQSATPTFPRKTSLDRNLARISKKEKIEVAEWRAYNEHGRLIAKSEVIRGTSIHLIPGDRIEAGFNDLITRLSRNGDAQHMTTIVSVHTHPGDGFGGGAQFSQADRMLSASWRAKLDGYTGFFGRRVSFKMNLLYRTGAPWFRFKLVGYDFDPPRPRARGARIPQHNALEGTKLEQATAQGLDPVTSKQIRAMSSITDNEYQSIIMGLSSSRRIAAAIQMFPKLNPPIDSERLIRFMRNLPWDGYATGAEFNESLRSLKKGSLSLLQAEEIIFLTGDRSMRRSCLGEIQKLKLLKNDADAVSLEQSLKQFI